MVGSRTAKIPVPSESAEQKAVIRWFAAFAATRNLDARLLFAIPNGAVLAGNSQRRAIQMSNLKANGLRVGVPDLMLAVPRGGFNGLFVEMKRVGGKTSDAQLEYHALLREQGYAVRVCTGAESAIVAIRLYLDA